MYFGALEADVAGERHWAQPRLQRGAPLSMWTGGGSLGSWL
jgi:hypothetical protein